MQLKNNKAFSLIELSIEGRKAVEKYLGQKWNINVSNNPSIG